MLICMLAGGVRSASDDGSTAAEPQPAAGQRSSAAHYGAEVALGCVLLAGGVLLLRWASSTWFTGDDWGLLTTDSLFSAHNDHWSTVVIAIHRVLYTLFGLGTYLPFQVVAVAVHLSVVALLFIVMRRAEVQGWVAVGVLVPFVFFVPGWILMLSQFQMTLALLLGLVQLLVADYPGRNPVRAGAAIVFGFLAIMSSG